MNASPSTPERWTSRKLLEWTTPYLARKGVDSPHLSAEMLLSHVLGTPRLKLYMDPDRPTTELERAAFRELVERAARHEPVDYLVGHAPFFSMMLKVTPAVLIPRPSTETLVEHVIQHSRRTPGFISPVIADIGTGSGAIAISLAKHIPSSRVIAVDISPDALAIAKENAAAQGVLERIDFVQGDLLTALRAGVRFSYLVSNPPYIGDEEWVKVEPNVKDYEPHLALRGGVDGLRYLRQLIEQGPAYLQSPGQLVLEFSSSQKQAMLDLARQNPGLSNAHILADHEALPRILVADKVG